LAHATGMTDSVSSSFTVNPAAASALAFTTQPGGATAGSAFGAQPVVKTQDAYGNNSTVGLPSSLNVAVSLNSGTGTLVGTKTLDVCTSADNGTVSYTLLSFPTRRSSDLLAHATGMTDSVSSSFTVSPAAASALAFTTQPGGATAGSA